MASVADWTSLARHVAKRRVELGMTQAALAVASGLSVATIRLIESAQRSSYRPLTLAAVDRGLRWESGSAERILAGHRPTPLRDFPELALRTDPKSQAWPEGFTDFFDTNYPKARRVAVRLVGESDADDVAQETMARALFMFQRAEGVPEGNWVEQVARNLAADLWRARGQVVPVGTEEEDFAEIAHLLTEPDIAGGVLSGLDWRNYVTAARAALSPNERELLVLRDFQDLSYVDIASRYSTSVTTIRQRLHRARARLARELRSRD